MRKIRAGLFVSLDGVADAPEQWQAPYMNQEVGEALGASMATADTILLGRRTYEEWAAFWPQQGPEMPFAAQINAARKLVASTTLQAVEWENSTLIDGDVSDELNKLKQGSGGDILINGSATLVRSLIRDGVLDELALLVHPVVVGGESRLFDGIDRTAMELLDSRTFSNGVVSLTYRPVAA